MTFLRIVRSIPAPTLFSAPDRSGWRGQTGFDGLGRLQAQILAQSRPRDQHPDRQSGGLIAASRHTGRWQSQKIGRHRRAHQRFGRHGSFRGRRIEAVLEGQLCPGGRQQQRAVGHEPRPRPRDAIALDHQMRPRRGISQWRHFLVEIVHEGGRILAHHRGQHGEHRAEIAHDQACPAAQRVFVARRAGFFHDIAGVGQRLRCTSHGRRHFWIGAATGRLGQHRHADRPHHRRAIEGGVDRPGVARVRADQYPQAEAHIGDAAGHRSLHVHELGREQSVFGRHITRVRHAAGRRADRCDAAGVGRIAQRAADVVAEANWAHAAGKCRRLASAGAAGGATGVPRIARKTVQRTHGMQTQRHVGQIGPSDRYRAGGAHALDHRRIGRRHSLGQRRHAPGGRKAGHVDILLHREWHAVQGPDLFTDGQLPVGQSCASARLLGQHSHHGVQRRVDGIDAGEVRIHHLSGAEVSTRNVVSQFGG